MNDGTEYGTTHREEMKRSMEYPAKSIRQVRRWWWNVSEDYKALVWIASVFMASVAFWGVWAVFPR